MISQALTPTDPQVFYSFIKEVSRSIGSPNPYFIFFHDFLFFFRSSFCNVNFANFPVQGMEAMESLVLNINKELKNILELPGESESVDIEDFEVNVSPKKLEGEETLWRILLEAQNEEVSIKAATLLNKLYTRLEKNLLDEIPEISMEFINTAVEKLKAFWEQMKGADRVKKILKLLKMIDEMVDESEVQESSKKLIPMDALINGQELSVEVTFFKDKKNECVTVKTHSKETLWNLRSLIADHLQTLPELVALYEHSGKLLNDKNNGTTLDKLRIEGQLHAVLKLTNRFPREAFITPKLTFTSKAMRVLEGVFQKVAETSKKLGKEEFKYVVRSLENAVDANKLVKFAFGKERSFLTLEQFVQSLESLLKDDQELIWKLLESLNYIEILKLRTRNNESKDKLHKRFPRYLLSNNPEYFEFFFKLFGNFALTLRAGRKGLHRRQQPHTQAGGFGDFVGEDKDSFGCEGLEPDLLLQEAPRVGLQPLHSAGTSGRQRGHSSGVQPGNVEGRLCEQLRVLLGDQCKRSASVDAEECEEGGGKGWNGRVCEGAVEFGRSVFDGNASRVWEVSEADRVFVWERRRVFQQGFAWEI